MFCSEVKEFLSRQQIDFVEQDVATDEAALSELQQLGYMSTPVTVVGEDVVLGFDRDKLRMFLKT